MIYKNKYFIENPKATIIIAHGIAEHSGRYDYLAKRFNKEGYDVITYDHIGHGKSGGKRGKLKSFHQMIDILHEIVLKEKERTNKKIFLLGHSMGGEIVNLYEAKYDDIDDIISSSAATNTLKEVRIFKYIGFSLLRWIKISTKRFDKFLAKDPAVLEKNKKDPLMLDHMYISLLGEMLVKGVNYLHKNINNFKNPILYIHGTKDGIVDYKFSQYMYDNIPTKDKEIILYDGEYHEMLNDYNKELIINDILKWLENHL